MLVKTIIASFFFLQACGQSANNLAGSIDRATTEASKENKSKTASTDTNTPVIDSNSNGATNSVTVLTSTTVTINEPTSTSKSLAVTDVLFGKWISQCDDGITMTMIFDGTTNTKITSVYEDLQECSGMPQTVTQRITYKIIGDNGISFGKGEVGGFNLDGKTLTFDQDPIYIYTRN